MKYLPFILLIIILIIPAITLLNLRKEIGIKQTDEGRVLYFYGNQDYRFSFISPKENLNSVVIKLKNISIRNSKPLFFYLNDNQNTIRQIKINGSNIGDSSMVRFAFSEIEESKNKEYTVILSSPESDINNAIGIHTDVLNHPVITTYHIPSSKTQLIIKVYKNFADKILVDKIFIALWLALFGTMVFIIKSLDI